MHLQLETLINIFFMFTISKKVPSQGTRQQLYLMNKTTRNQYKSERNISQLWKPSKN